MRTLTDGVIWFEAVLRTANTLARGKWRAVPLLNDYLLSRKLLRAPDPDQSRAAVSADADR